MGDLAARVTACTDDILSWMQSYRLQLNSDKKALIWCLKLRHLQQLQTTLIGVEIRYHSSFIFCPRSLLLIDADLSRQTYVQRTVESCFDAVRRRSMPSTALQSLVVSLVSSPLDYGNEKTCQIEYVRVECTMG